MQPKPPQLDRVAFSQVAVGAIIISFAPTIIKLSTLGPAVQGVYRMLFGGGLLLIFALFRRESLWPSPQAVGFAALGALCFAGDLFFWQQSIQYIGPGLATILVNMQVFVLAFVGSVFFHERFMWRKRIAFVLVLIGLLLLVGVEWTQFSAQYHIGVFMALLSAVFYAGFILVLRQSQFIERSMTPVANLTMTSLLCGVFLTVMGLLQHESFVMGTKANWFYMITYGVTTQGIAWLLITKGLPRLRISLAGLLLLLQPSLAFIWDLIIFQRPTPPVEFSGAILTLIAIYFGSTGGKALNKP